MPDSLALKTEWDLSGLYYSGFDDPRIAQDKRLIEEAVAGFAGKWKDRTDWLSNSRVLAQALADWDELALKGETWGKPGYYGALRHHLASSDGEVQAYYAATQQWSDTLDTQLTFFLVRLTKIDSSLHAAMLADPALAPWKHYLEKTFAMAAHTLSEDAEEVLGLLSRPAYANWREMTAAFMEGEERQVADEDGHMQAVPFSALGSLFSSSSKQVRDDANLAFLDVVAKHLPVAEREVNSLLLFHKATDGLKGFSRPDSERLLADDLEPAVVDSLRVAVEEKYEAIAHRYFALKAKLAGQDRLAYHERLMPYGETNLRFTPEESFSLVHTSFAALDPQFAQIIQDLFTNGQVDVMPRPGKTGGGFCWQPLAALPTHILLNFSGRVGDVTTMAHEFGHALNNEFMSQNQGPLNAHGPTCTAEVASTFFEAFIFNKLMQDADPETRLHLAMNRMDRYMSTIFMQVCGYGFEREMHEQFREKGNLKSEELGALYRKHMERQFGSAVDLTDCESRWASWSHLRMFFYIYSYAMGELISLSLQAIVQQDPANIEKVKTFLSAGSAHSPKDIFAAAGIDITDQEFWQYGLGQVMADLEETEALAKELGKIS
jgi:oligoendopeptidase F